MKTVAWLLPVVTAGLIAAELVGWATVPWPVHAYLIVSVVTLAFYAVDKKKAGKGGQRIPERVLHLLELGGGWPGGLIGQQALRHKTRKFSYQAVFWLIGLMHAGFWGWWFFVR